MNIKNNEKYGNNDEDKKRNYVGDLEVDMIKRDAIQKEKKTVSNNAIMDAYAKTKKRYKKTLIALSK